MEPAFEVVWVVYETRRGSVAQLRSVLLPDEALDDNIATAAAWAQVFKDHNPDLTAPVKRLWDAYRAAADGQRVADGGEILRALELESGFVVGEEAAQEVDDLLFDHDGRSGYELLLRWASERGSGTWAEFRDAHDWLFNAGKADAEQVKATTSIHALSMLGHVEIDWESGRWAAAPAALTILPFAGAHAVLAGSRTRRMALN